MALQRPLKLLALILGGIVALIVLTVIAVAMVVDPNDYKDRLEAAVEEQTGRPLTLEGDLKLSFFPWLALELGPAQLGQPPGFEAGPVLVVEKAQVGVKLIPLLGKRLEVSRLGLEGMKVNLVKNADGRTNWEDLTAEGEEQPQPAQGEAPDIGTIGGLSVRDAAFDYRDLQAGTRRRVQDLDIETGAINPGEPVDLDVNVVMDEGPETATTTAKLKTVLTMDTEEERYQLARLVLDATQRGAEKDAREMAIGLRADTVDLDLKKQLLALPQFTATYGGAELTGNLEGRQIVDSPAIAGQIAMKETSPRELMRQMGMEVPRTRDPEALRSLILNSKIRTTDNSVAFDDLTLVLDGQQVRGNLGIADLEKMALRFDLEADRLDLSRYEDPTGDEEEKKSEDSEPFELPVEALRKLDAKGSLTVGSLKVAGINMSDVTLRMNAGGGATRLNPVQAKIFGGEQRGSVSVNASRPVATVNLDESLTGVDFARMFEELFDSKRVTGKGNAKAVLSGHGNDSSAILGTLDGRVDFEVADGAIVGADLWYEIRRARALWKKEAMPAEASTGITRFHKLRGSAVIQDGVVTNRDFIMDMEHLKVRGEGTLALTTKKVDYRLTAEVYRPPAPADQPASQPAGEASVQRGAEAVAPADVKEMEIPVRVSGTLDDLKVRPDAAAFARQEVQKRQGELKEKALDKISDWLGRKKKNP
jgi:AsmA protein